MIIIDEVEAERLLDSVPSAIKTIDINGQFYLLGLGECLMILNSIQKAEIEAYKPIKPYSEQPIYEPVL